MKKAPGALGLDVQKMSWRAIHISLLSTANRAPPCGIRCRLPLALAQEDVVLQKWQETANSIRQNALTTLATLPLTSVAGQEANVIEALMVISMRMRCPTARDGSGEAQAKLQHSGSGSDLQWAKKTTGRGGRGRPAFVLPVEQPGALSAISVCKALSSMQLAGLPAGVWLRRRWCWRCNGFEKYYRR